jgi:hypothetical protein
MSLLLLCVIKSHHFDKILLRIGDIISIWRGKVIKVLSQLLTCCYATAHWDFDSIVIRLRSYFFLR